MTELDKQQLRDLAEQVQEAWKRRGLFLHEDEAEVHTAAMLAATIALIGGTNV